LKLTVVFLDAMPHTIEVFTAGCPLCERTLAAVEIGKCASCVMIERNLAKEPTAHRDLVRRYKIRSVPTIVIDGRIKFEGEPDFNWMCGDEFYAWLERTYPMR